MMVHQLLAFLMWDTIQCVWDGYWRRHALLRAGGDALAATGFVAILIANGVISNRVWGYHSDKTMLLAYNSFPWIIGA